MDGQKHENNTNMQVSELCKAYSVPVKSFIKSLIQCNSVNGESNESRVVERVVQEATKLGLSYKILESEVGRPNLFIGDNFDKKVGLLFVAHSDTVPVGDKAQWKYDPFEGIEAEGRLYGRGAMDCKSGIALSLYSLEILKELGYPAYAKVAVGVDEESGLTLNLV